jgi:hypothetical protein
MNTAQTISQAAPLIESEKIDFMFIGISSFGAPAPAGRDVYRTRRSYLPSPVKERHLADVAPNGAKDYQHQKL